jgi:hypothetical protein
METQSVETAKDIISRLSENAQKLDTPGVREDVISQAFRLVGALETPMESLLRMEWVEVCLIPGQFPLGLPVDP